MESEGYVALRGEVVHVKVKSESEPGWPDFKPGTMIEVVQIDSDTPYAWIAPVELVTTELEATRNLLTILQKDLSALRRTEAELFKRISDVAARVYQLMEEEESDATRADD